MADDKKIFVYGTLLGGIAACKVWPHASSTIEKGCVQAEMYNLGPYPAIIPGTTWIIGELHTLSDEVWDETLKTLDAFEEYDPYDLAKSLYLRKLISVETENGRHQAWAYFLHSPKILQDLDTRYQSILPSVLFMNRRCAAWRADSHQT